MNEETPAGVPPKSGGCGLLLVGGVVVVALAAAGGLAYWLSHGGGDRAALDAYVAASRHGTPPSSDADADTIEATRALATSTDVTVHNFKTVYGTSCWSTNVDTPAGALSMDFLLKEDQGAWRVASVSTHRPCNCVRSGPRAQQGCALR